MRVLLIASPEGGAPDTAHADVLVLAHPPATAPDWLDGLRRRPGAPALYVRVAPGATDFEAALALRPDGIVLPRVADGIEIARLAVGLAVHEAEAGLPDGATRILAGFGTARGLMRLATVAGPRLAGLFWEPSDLARDLGLDAVDPEPWPAPLAQARGLLVLAAAATGVPALDAPCASAGPDATLRAARAARRDGFRGGFAEDAAAAATLARVFAPGRDEPRPAPAFPDDRSGGGRTRDPA
ncbi:aldolase/citrate lyase family protein [uncultured Methylobacterium sp.]|uniref:aldolase/citrate lyase family protein n=1 Tax=uncultured Methylobacterium sp. TaxID=157278 RepID=UPI0035CB21BA